MPTFQVLRQNVAKRLLDPLNTAVSDSDVGTAINDAIRYWKFHRFWFNTDDAPITLTPQNAVLDLATIQDFLVELPMDDGFVLNYNQQRYRLFKKNNATYDDGYQANGCGRPQIYTTRSGEYHCYPIPDQAYACQVYYLKDYADLQANGDTNDFTTYAARIIQLWAIANLISEFKQDDKMEAYYRSAANDEYANLGIMTERVDSPGHLTIDTFL